MVFKFPKVSMVQKGTVLVLRFFFVFFSALISVCSSYCLNSSKVKLVCLKRAKGLFLSPFVFFLSCFDCSMFQLLLEFKQEVKSLVSNQDVVFSYWPSVNVTVQLELSKHLRDHKSELA